MVIGSTNARRLGYHMSRRVVPNCQYSPESAYKSSAVNGASESQLFHCHSQQSQCMCPFTFWLAL